MNFDQESKSEDFFSFSVFFFFFFFGGGGGGGGGLGWWDSDQNEKINNR